MERKTPFVPGEYYHVFSRGVEKRDVFLSTADYERFLALLYILNQEKTFHISNFLSNRNRRIVDVFDIDRQGQLVSILAFSLLPNHFHLLIRENIDAGISKFMAKLLTAYSMYFNLKYDRSGPLFVKPFRSVYVDGDGHFRHLFSYIHMNCLDLHESSWKERGLSDHGRARDFLDTYRYSSYPDFVNDKSTRPEAEIIDPKAIPDFIWRTPLDIEEMEGWYVGDGHFRL